MEKKNQISDELLAKYMSGQATPAEEAEVLDYLAEDDENLKDFLQICSAVEANQSHSMRLTNKGSRKNFWVAVAAIAIVLIATTVFLLNYRSPGNQFAQQQESSDATTPQNVSDTTGSTQMQVPDSSIQLQISPNTQIPQIVEPKNYADSSKKKNYANVVYPAAKLTSVSRDKKSMNFIWNTDAVDINFRVKDENDVTITDKRFPARRNYTLLLPDDKDTLHWQAIFTYSDGSSTIKKGTIIRWDVGVDVVNKQKDR